MPSVVVVPYLRAVEDGTALALWTPMVVLQTCAGGIAMAFDFGSQRLNFASQRSDFPLNVCKIARAHGQEHTAPSLERSMLANGEPQRRCGNLNLGASELAETAQDHGHEGDSGGEKDAGKKAICPIGCRGPIDQSGVFIDVHLGSLPLFPRRCGHFHGARFASKFTSHLNHLKG